MAAGRPPMALFRWFYGRLADIALSSFTVVPVKLLDGLWPNRLVFEAQANQQVGATIETSTKRLDATTYSL